MKRLPVVVLVQGLIIITLAAAVTWFGRDEFASRQEREEEEIVTASRAEEEEGRPVVRLPQASQQASGIAVKALEAAGYAGSQTLYGTVVDAAPLIEARSRLVAAQSEIPPLQVELAQRSHDAERLAQLNRDDRNVSDRAAEAAQAEAAVLRSRIEASRRQLASAQESLRAAWGERLARLAAEDDGALAPLASGREVLLEMSLPPGVRGAPQRLTVSPAGDATAKADARLLGRATRQTGQTPGATWHYLAKGDLLRVGQRVTASAGGDRERAGVVVPEAAVVWYGGRAWVYVQEEADEFVRRPLDTRHELPEGWFAESGFEPGEKVVIEGAQLLLSEEFKYQITNENED